jgi:hypothetical protein
MVKRKLSYILALTFVIQLTLTNPAQTFDGENVEFDGFLLGNLSGRTTGVGPGGRLGGDILLGEERFRLNVLTWSESVEASGRVRVDLLHDALMDEFALDLREAYFDYTTGKLDFRFGRQIATWGVGDLLFINDLFPKDWVSFFSGRPLEYLKVGVDGLRTTYSSSIVNFDVIVVPVFEPDNAPTPDRFILFDPLREVSSRTEESPDVSFKNAELAIRLYWRMKGFDLAGYAYRGFWKTPSARLWTDDVLMEPNITFFYPELSVYGFSAQGSGLGGVINIETGYYHSRADEVGTDPTIPNSQVRFLAGYQRQLMEDLSAGVQYYAEVMEDHSNYKANLPQGSPETERYRDIVTLRLNRLLKHQTLRLSLFVFYSPVDKDYLGQPQISYKLSDEFTISVGANIFGGKNETTFFGQFDKNDNVYTSMRFDF